MKEIFRYITNMLLKTAIVLACAAAPLHAAAPMNGYCLMPPYVKRDITPNILIVMDNAVDMGEPAYCTKDPNWATNNLCDDNYTPVKADGTPNIYSGYYQPYIKYSYSSNRYVPDPNGIYSGNLLNWATMSKYDLLQYILVGGISTSRQTNINTLISRSNTWQKMLAYDNHDGLGTRTCIINVNNANVEFTETTYGTCGYLDSPAHPLTLNDPAFASATPDYRFAMEGNQGLSHGDNSWTREDQPQDGGVWSRIWSAVMDFLVPPAEAASQLRISGGPSALPGATQCTPYIAISISASGGTAPYQWSITGGSLPPGMSYTPSGTPSTVISGIPSASGPYSFTLHVKDSVNNTDSKTYSISVTAATVTILATSPLQDGYVGNYYLVYLNPGVTSACSTGDFTWNVTSGSLPPGLYIYNPPGNYNIFELYGTPTTAGTYNFTLTATDPNGNTSLPKSFTITIQPAPFGLSITTGSPLQSGTVGSYYWGYIMTPYAAPGTTYPCTWSITSGSLPPGMSFGYYGGDPSSNPWTYSYVYGTPSQRGTYTFTVQVVDSFGNSQSKQFTLTINKGSNQPRTTGFVNVEVCTGNYTYQCGNVGGLTYDPVTGWPAGSGCSNSNQTTCVLKTGLVDQVWSQARLGVMDFNKASHAGNDYANPNIKNCITQSPGPRPDPNFLTSIENAVAIDPPTTLVNGEYESVNYYATDTSSNCNPYVGAPSCVNSFILALTAGTGADNPPNPSLFLTPEVFNTGVPSQCPSTLSNLATNACYGYNIPDLRSDVPGRQYVSTFIVNTMGTPSGATYNVANTPVTTGDILKQAASYGGGIYYEVTDPTTLKASLTQAFQDIIKRAAAGTAASVLASGEGNGANLIQAVFYPLKQFGNDEISWIGRLTNFWYYVDPRFVNSAMRADDGDKILNLKTDATHHDYITSLYFDSATQTTMATRWQDTNGDGVVDGSPLTPDIAFEDLGNLWEAGSLLWSRTPSSRNVITSIANGATMTFSATNRTALSSYLQAGSDSEAEAIIRWTRGEDTPFLPAINPAFTPNPDYRKRSVTIGGVGPYPWKLGDVINSTPKISSWLPLSAYHKIYSDYTYGVPGQDPILEAPADSTHFVTSAGYKGRGMVFTGANDGMLHAFRLGTLRLSWTGQQTMEKARLTNTFCSVNNSVSCMTDSDCAAVSAGVCNTAVTLGDEAWAFIPKNVLPYLRYMADANYGGCHLYSVDLTPYIFDASIGDTTTGDISGSSRTVSSWRTILIGGMRYGGACSNLGSTCTDCVQTPVANLGYSSYFALDITNQNSPVLLWEYNNPQLGFTTAGPAIVRISSRDPVTNNPVSGNNGKWFVVLPSGPTGPIDSASKQFLGRSDQNLRLFVLNLKDGSLAATINTGIPYAFAGSMYNATLDTDLNYQDDVVYVPYVEQAADGTWTDGGVGRLTTKEDPDPTHWVWSTVMDHIGPVTSAITKLQNNSTHTLWLFFGTGRYYFESGGTTDDGAGQRQIFGVKEPCFSAAGFDPNCTSSRMFGSLTDVTSISSVPTDPDAAGFKGWYINLDGDGVPSSSFRAERVITDPLASTNGVVYFTTYKPYSDQCALGGQSFLWAVKYNSGGSAGTLLVGKALIQVSTGAIEQLNLSNAFTDAGGRKSPGMEGVPPQAQGLSILTAPPPVKRVLHIRER